MTRFCKTHVSDRTDEELLARHRELSFLLRHAPKVNETRRIQKEILSRGNPIPVSYTVGSKGVDIQYLAGFSQPTIIPKDLITTDGLVEGTFIILEGAMALSLKDKIFTLYKVDIQGQPVTSEQSDIIYEGMDGFLNDSGLGVSTVAFDASTDLSTEITGEIRMESGKEHMWFSFTRK